MSISDRAAVEMRLEIKRLEAENQTLREEQKSRVAAHANIRRMFIDQVEKLKRANEIAVKALEAIATSSQKDEFLSDVEYRHRISGIYFSSEKALAEIKGIL